MDSGSVSSHSSRRSILSTLVTWGGLVKFSHSVFALPFALIMLVVVNRSQPVTAQQLVAILICVVSARTAAMAFNRLVDASIDRQNPRTRMREIPAGKVSSQEAVSIVIAASAVFCFAASMLGTHCLRLTPVVLVLLLGYSLMKHVSSLCHFVLGVALACAPGGVWYALTATWAWEPVILMGAVLTWVAGFDILYSCQDVDFDRSQGLHSVPRWLGIRASFAVSSLLHVFTVLLLLWFGSTFSLGVVYSGGVALFAALLASQHITIMRRGISCIDQVFFTRNGAASIMLFLSVLADSWM